MLGWFSFEYLMSVVIWTFFIFIFFGGGGFDNARIMGYSLIS
jgi:hypothetical protein